MRKVLLLLLAWVALSFYSFSESTLLITSLNWEPYSGAKLTNEGASIQKLRQILSENDIKLLVEFYPWERSQYLAKTRKEYFGFFPAWPEEVDEGFIASSPVDWSEIGILINNNKMIIFDGVEELFQKYKVGLIQTYVYPKEIEDAAKKYKKNVDLSINENVLLKKLSTNRIDAAITDPNVMLFLAEDEGIENIELSKIVTQKELVIAVKDSPENRELLKKINKFLSENK